MQFDKNKILVRIGFFFVGAFSALVVALGLIQGIKGEAYTAMAQNQRLRTVDVQEFGRGQILDRHHKSFTNNAENCLVIFPSVFGEAQFAFRELQHKLRSLEIASNAKLDLKGQEGQVMARGLNEVQTAELNRYIADRGFKGAYVLRLQPRYGENSLASHLLGFVGEDTESLDLVGKAGLEKQYESFLRNFGTEKIGVVVDEKGRQTVQELRLLKNPLESQEEAGQRGNLVLTLDKEYQEIAEAALAEKSGAVVMLDIHSGDVLAMASTPNYDQAKGQPPVQGDLYLNKALAYYPPASVFKLVLALAVLDNDLAYPKDFYCDGGVTLKNGHRVACWYEKGHGQEDMSRALGNSCNPYFIGLGQLLGGDLIKEYTYKLGLTKQQLVGYNAGTMAENLSFNSKVEGDVANVSIGEKGIRLTPLLVAQLLATIANDGKLITPRLVIGVADDLGNWLQAYKSSVPRQVVKAESAKVLQEMLAQAVLAGTGTPVASRIISAGGKSGTSQNQGVWFAGFAPVEQPKWAISVYLPNGNSGGKDAGLIFKEIIEKVAISEGLAN